MCFIGKLPGSAENKTALPDACGQKVREPVLRRGK
jgi:hypothetical protein